MDLNIIAQVREVISSNMNIVVWLIMSIGTVWFVDVLIRPILKLVRAFKGMKRNTRGVIYQSINSALAIGIGFFNYHMGTYVITHSWLIDCFLVAMGAYSIHMIGWIRLREILVRILSSIPVVGKVFADKEV